MENSAIILKKYLDNASYSLNFNMIKTYFEHTIFCDCQVCNEYFYFRITIFLFLLFYLIKSLFIAKKELFKKIKDKNFWVSVGIIFFIPFCLYGIIPSIIAYLIIKRNKNINH